MMICMKLTRLAVLQKICGWGIVLMSAGSGMELGRIIFGCLFGILISEIADVWYMVCLKTEKIFKISNKWESQNGN